VTFLTRFHIDPRSRAGAGVLENPRRMHKVVAEATAKPNPQDNEASGRTLWRLDRDSPADPLLWIVSPLRPELDGFAADGGREVSGVVYESKLYDRLLARLDTGQVYAFRLAANAVHSGRRTPDSPETQRFAHVTASQQLSWLESRCEAHGFLLRKSSTGEPDAAVVGRRRFVFGHRDGRVTLTVSDFMGHLEVCDAALLQRTLTRGMGHGRAYGCGLLTLAAPKRR